MTSNEYTDVFLVITLTIVPNYFTTQMDSNVFHFFLFFRVLRFQLNLYSQWRSRDERQMKRKKKRQKNI